MNNGRITIQAHINADGQTVWRAWNTPEEICHWNSASDDWYCPQAENDLRPAGRFRYRMAARDGSAAFDFEGVYDRIQERAAIDYTMGDGRKVSQTFTEVPDGVDICVAFDPEGENALELQRAGWQAILDHFKRYVEGKA